MIIKTRHTGLVVKDIGRSIQFYKSLGLEVWKREIESGYFISQVVGISNAEIETAKLKVSDNSMLELLEYKSHPSKAHKQIYPSNYHGCSHVAFSVTDIDEIYKNLESIGGKLVNSPEISDNGLFKVMYCHDPDGILIEMVEEL